MRLWVVQVGRRSICKPAALILPKILIVLRVHGFHINMCRKCVEIVYYTISNGLKHCVIIIPMRMDGNCCYARRRDGSMKSCTIMVFWPSTWPPGRMRGRRLNGTPSSCDSPIRMDPVLSFILFFFSCDPVAGRCALRTRYIRVLATSPLVDHRASAACNSRMKAQCSQTTRRSSRNNHSVW